MSDFYEEGGKGREEERGGDKAKAEEQPALEPVAMGGEGAEKEVIAAIIIDPFQMMPVSHHFGCECTPYCRWVCRCQTRHLLISMS